MAHRDSAAAPPLLRGVEPAAIWIAAAVDDAAPPLAGVRAFVFRLFEFAGDAAAPPPLALAASAGEPVATASRAVSVTIASESGATPEDRTSAGGIVMAACGSGAASMAHPELAEIVVIELATHSLVRRCCS